jgi:hypothetical protein
VKYVKYTGVAVRVNPLPVFVFLISILAEYCQVDRRVLESRPSNQIDKVCEQEIEQEVE